MTFSARTGCRDTSGAGQRGGDASEAASRAARRTSTTAPAAQAGSARRARPDRPARGEVAAGGGAGSRAHGAAPGSRSPSTRCARGPAPRARARDGQRDTRTTTVGNGEEWAGARRGRTVLGSIEGTNCQVRGLLVFSDPTGTISINKRFGSITIRGPRALAQLALCRACCR